jgi:hypothetical protein
VISGWDTGSLPLLKGNSPREDELRADLALLDVDEVDA